MSLFSVCPSWALAQTLEWVRATSGEGTSAFIWDVALDRSGNVYAAGGYAGPIDMDGDGMPDAEDRGFGDILLARYDPDGVLQWIVTPGGLGIEQARGVAVDAEGNSYITGFVQEDADFGGAGTPDVMVTDYDHLFLAKFDSAGVFQWARSFCGSGEGVATDPEGGVYVAGTAAFCADIDGDGEADVDGRGPVLARYDAEGGLDWYRFIEVSELGEAFGLAVSPSGLVHVTGSVFGAADFSSSGTPEVTCTSGGCMFLATYDRSGALAWVRSAGAASGDARGTDIAVTPSGAIFVSGSFQGAADFTGDGAADTRDAGNGDGFLARYDAEGSFSWVSAFGAEHGGEGLGVAADGDLVVVSGVAGGRVDFDGDGTYDFIGGDLVLLGYHVDGAPLWSRVPGTSGWAVTFGAVAVEGDALAAGGTFSGSLDLDANGSQDASSDDGLFVALFSLETGTRTHDLPGTIPGGVILAPSYPNPFSSSTTIRFMIHHATPVRVAIYDLMGRQVALLIDEALPPGVHEVDWQIAGAEVPAASGAFICRVTTPSHSASRLLLHVK